MDYGHVCVFPRRTCSGPESPESILSSTFLSLVSPLALARHLAPSSIMASSASPAPPHKHSCLLCARRKIKCDKQDPKCSNCTKSHAECIYQAPPLPQRHRKRQADEELLSRLNHYEELLRSHKIDFKPSANTWTPQSVQEAPPPKVSRASPPIATLETVPPCDKSGDG
jgi:hypothetical protein